ncbi:hypothetical protein [Leptospira alstonii]|uniref:hypothetical protein n=1 Tax=Leptospira alstonii TaxID=28452 RepID=UPI00056D992B|nr:hypothetical protein [Leptospira alstonii]
MNRRNDENFSSNLLSDFGKYFSVRRGIVDAKAIVAGSTNWNDEQISLFEEAVNLLIRAESAVRLLAKPRAGFAPSFFREFAFLILLLPKSHSTCRVGYGFLWVAR